MPRITTLHYRKLVKIFELAGWKLHHQRGSHLHFVKAGFRRPVIIPTYKEVPIFIIENNLKTAEISTKQYFELLKKI